MESESKTQHEGMSLQTIRTIRTSRRIRKRIFVQSLRKLKESRSKNIERNKRLLINKSFIGHLLHDKLNINAHNIIKVTKNYTSVSKIFNCEQLELHKTCANREKINERKRKHATELKTLTNNKKHRFIKKTKGCDASLTHKSLGR